MKRWKLTRVVSVLLALALLLAAAPRFTLTAKAAASGACGENLTWSFDEASGTLTISGYGDMYDYGYYNPDEKTAPWQSAASSIEKLSLPQGLTSIGSYAFFGTALTGELMIPNKVKRIGADAFYGCGDLEGVAIPVSVESIGEDVFCQCSNLTAIRVSAGNPVYSSIVGVLFSKDQTELLICPEGKSGAYRVPDGVKAIRDGSFLLCRQLKSVAIPASVESIGHYSFYYTTNLEAFTVDPGNPIYSSDDGVLYDHSKAELFMCPKGKRGVCRVSDGVTSIGDDAFNDCPWLTGVTLSDSVAHIGNCAFWNCNNLTEINVGPCNPNLSSAEGVLFNKDMTVLLALPDGKTGDYVVPESVNLIAFGAITSSNLTSIAILNPECEIYDFENMLGNWRTTTVLGYAGSKVEQYAKDNGYTFKAIDPKTGFTDVSDGVYYADPLAWAVEKGVTNGTAAYIFSPESTCTRAQAVTFLWRAAGSPEPAMTGNPFADVAEGQYYYKAVLWAVEKGITTGTSADKFSPNSGCTRGQVATFLWRAAGRPEPESTTHPFTDVRVGEYYEKPVIWAVENGITTGTSANRFGPASTCTRGQIVTFLYRAADKV